MGSQFPIPANANQLGTFKIVVLRNPPLLKFFYSPSLLALREGTKSMIMAMPKRRRYATILNTPNQFLHGNTVTLF